MNTRKDSTLSEKQELLKKSLPNKCTQREVVPNLQISQPFLNKLLKSRLEIETACVESGSKSRKRKRCGKDEDVEKILKQTRQ